MEHFQKHLPESAPTPERGSNVTVHIDLIRHPEKEYATGKLTEEGKKKLLEKLTIENREGDYDTVKFYVSSLPRGKESLEPIGEFLKRGDIKTTPRVREGLMGRITEVGTDLKDEVKKLIDREHQSATELPDDPERPSHEPHSEDFESAANEILIRDFFDVNFPDSPIGGKDLAQEIDDFVKHLGELAHRLKSGSRVKFVLVSHSGIIEHFVKLVYLKQHPELKADEVSVDDIGGLVHYMNGPKISIVSDDSGKQTAKVEWNGLSLDYQLE